MSRAKRPKRIRGAHYVLIFFPRHLPAGASLGPPLRSQRPGRAGPAGRASLAGPVGRSVLPPRWTWTPRPWHWACRDPGSNRGPSDLQSDALPAELSRLLGREAGIWPLAGRIGQQGPAPPELRARVGAAAVTLGRAAATPVAWGEGVARHCFPAAHCSARDVLPVHVTLPRLRGAWLPGQTTPVGFEPTRGDPIGLAGRRLSRSAKVS